MTLKRIFPAAATAVLCLATAGLVHAQRPFAAMGGENTVTGTGVEIVRHPPEILRMQIEITAKGKTLANALKKLAEHREAALAQLAKMSSEKEGTRAGEAQIAATTNPRQQQMEMMVRQRMRQSGKKAKTTPDKPLSVSCTLTAEWKLRGKTSEELLLEAHAIEDKVRAADLAGHEAEEKTPEEEELAEEMEQQMPNFGDDNQPKPGEPVFMFVSKISAQDRAKATATAFSKARQQAEELSVAAGAQLGELRSLSRYVSPSAFSYGANGPYGNMRNQRMMQMMGGGSEHDEDDGAEATGAQPGEVVLPINVTAAFQLKTAK